MQPFVNMLMPMLPGLILAAALRAEVGAVNLNPAVAVPT